MHVDTPGQDTQNNWPVGATGFGLGTFAHPDPDALAPAGTASAEAVSTMDAMTAKMTRSRTVRIGPPLVTPEPMLPSLNAASVLPSWHGVNSRAGRRPVYPRPKQACGGREGLSAHHPAGLQRLALGSWRPTHHEGVLVRCSPVQSLR